MQKNMWWKVRHSVWIIFAFVWFINWTPFLYVGIRAKKKKWILSAIVYLVTCLGPFIIHWSEGALYNVIMVIFLIGWLAGIVHAFAIRKEFLLIMETMEELNDKELKWKVEKEYRDSRNLAEKKTDEDALQGIPEKDRSKVREINSMVERIYESLKLIKSKSQGKDQFMIFGRFTDAIKEYEDVLPIIVKNFFDGVRFLDRYSGIEQEISECESKIMQTEGQAQKTYEKVLNEKRDTLKEINQVKSSLSESESRIYLILCELQKIEAILESAKMSDGLTNEDVTKLNGYLETFTENIKGSLQSIKT